MSPVTTSTFVRVWVYWGTAPSLIPVTVWIPAKVSVVPAIPILWTLRSFGSVVSLEINFTISLAVTIPTKVPTGAVIVLRPGFVPPLPLITKGVANLFLVDNFKSALKVVIPVGVPW